MQEHIFSLYTLHKVGNICLKHIAKVFTGPVSCNVHISNVQGKNTSPKLYLQLFIADMRCLTVMARYLSLNCIVHI